jgi:LDH2 family malate/lactate/ureidoglycolate dehydrogenase
MPEINYRYYPEPLLRSFLEAYFSKLGDNPVDAAINSDAVINGALRWIPAQGQGLEKLFRHTRQVLEGGLLPNADMQFVTDRPAVALLDAAKGSGFVAATKAMCKAVEKAKIYGIGCVLVRHSNHFGTSGYYAGIAAENGMVGIAFTNAGPEMAPWGAKTGVLGTNPWGIALPRFGKAPIILDMALTMSGLGMIRWAYQEGREVPITWGLTADGRRTTDPAELLEGATQLPIGDFKGYGLSFMTDAIAGVLSGAKFGLDCYRDLTDLDVGHCLLALDPEAFMPRKDFENRLQILINQIKSAVPIDPKNDILLPGDLELLRMQKRLQEGIPVDPDTVERVRKLCQEIGVDCPL